MIGNDWERAYLRIFHVLDTEDSEMGPALLADHVAKSLESLFVEIREEAWADGYFEGGGLNG